MKITIKQLRHVIQEELSKDEIGYESFNHPKYGMITGNEKGTKFYHIGTDGKPTHDKPFPTWHAAMKHAMGADYKQAIKR